MSQQSSEKFNGPTESTGQQIPQQQGTTQTAEREGTDQRSQSQYDKAFGQQMAPAVYAQGPATEWAQEYFALAEETVRSARRVTELQTLHLMRQEIVSDVKQQVLAELRSAGII